MKLKKIVLITYTAVFNSFDYYTFTIKLAAGSRSQVCIPMFLFHLFYILYT